ncbi:MAG: NTP transferase domain-containing protein [Clostridiales Family XIII bacterium]|jgi:CTP:molybdopterin cytidylyltransferase MocA|nr:NTP transferase domain-containing protein [Clostridiales Family XIII bacterium]
MNANIGVVIVAAGLSSRMGEYKPLMKIGGETIAQRVVGAFLCAGANPIVVVTGHKANELEAHLREYARTHPRKSIDEYTNARLRKSVAHTEICIQESEAYTEACLRESVTHTEARLQEPVTHTETLPLESEAHTNARLQESVAHTEANVRNNDATDNPSVIQFIRNEAYATTPMFASAKIGLAYILGKCARTFFCPIDVPLFTAGTVRKLMDCGAPVAKPVYKGKEGHPILIDAELIPAIIGLGRTCGAEATSRKRTGNAPGDEAIKTLGDEAIKTPGSETTGTPDSKTTGAPGCSKENKKGNDGGMKGALAKFESVTERIEVPDEGILYDADTPEDITRLLNLL